jgi:hypothetical protein
MGKGKQRFGQPPVGAARSLTIDCPINCCTSAMQHQQDSKEAQPATSPAVGSGSPEVTSSVSYAGRSRASMIACGGARASAMIHCNGMKQRRSLRYESPPFRPPPPFRRAPATPIHQAKYPCQRQPPPAVSRCLMRGWQVLTRSVCQEGTDASLGKMGRTPAHVAVYWDYRSEVRYRQMLSLPMSRITCLPAGECCTQTASS